jgi:hypothetical protein
MIRKIKSFFQRKNTYLNQIPEIYSILNNDRKSYKVNLGQIQARLNLQLPSIKNLSEVEFQVFSQWGDDGIIQYLVSRIDIQHKTFVEFGVEHYKESNTRFLLINNNYSGLVMDGGKANIDFIQSDDLFWLYDLHAVHAFITAENINSLLTDFLNKGYDKEIGILSIDIDGNDYYIWEKIDVVNPVIVIVEYNAAFGYEHAWSIPYVKDFTGFSSGANRYYWGASLHAFCYLADQKGYSFIGCNSNGNNAYFVRNDKIGPFKKLSVQEGFVDAKFKLSEHAKAERGSSLLMARTLKGMPIFDVIQKKLVTI